MKTEKKREEKDE